jgi:hypothetical protein
MCVAPTPIGRSSWTDGAVAAGFEPARELPPYTLSRRAPSSARAGHPRGVYEEDRTLESACTMARDLRVWTMIAEAA